MVWLIAGIAVALAEGPKDPSTGAEPSPAEPAAVPTAPLVSLDLVDADIHGVLRLFGQWARLNIVASDDVSGKITVQLHEVPWDQAFQVVLLSKGLTAVWMETGTVVIQPSLP